jgi:dipeptidyl aminopeptidase/acylaminoacyl peptidase
MRVALGWLVFIVLAVASPAWATFPGRNGLLAFDAYEVNEQSTDILIEDTFFGIARIPGGPRHIFARGSEPAFSPTGRSLAYGGSGSRKGIWVTRPDCRRPKGRSALRQCSRLRRLTRGDDYSPAWSPSGKRIAFVRGRYPERIFTVRANGGGLRFLVRGSAPDWSSKGALAFRRARDELRVRAPGGRVRRLPVRGIEPSWAPDGNRLAFVGKDEDAEGKALYTVNADGSGLQKLVEFEDYGVTYWGALSPTWSPDGRWIAFIKTGEPPYTGPVYAVRPSGGRPRLLMHPVTDCRLCFSGLNFSALAWQARQP